MPAHKVPVDDNGFSPSIATRIYTKLRKMPNGCIEWTGARTPGGYGRVGKGGRGQSWTVVHRAVWTLIKGPIPEGMILCHACDNPPCCNVEHLFLGDQKDNIQDMIRKGRAVYLKGEKHPDAKLTDQQVAELRRLAPSVNNHAELGRMFGISKQHARSLVLRQRRA